MAPRKKPGYVSNVLLLLYYHSSVPLWDCNLLLSGVEKSMIGLLLLIFAWNDSLAEPDVEIQSFLDDQLKIAIGIFPWLLLIGIVIGFLYFVRKHLKL